MFASTDTTCIYSLQVLERRGHIYGTLAIPSKAKQLISTGTLSDEHPLEAGMFTIVYINGELLIGLGMILISPAVCLCFLTTSRFQSYLSTPKEAGNTANMAGCPKQVTLGRYRTCRSKLSNSTLVVGSEPCIPRVGLLVSNRLLISHPTNSFAPFLTNQRLCRNSSRSISPTVRSVFGQGLTLAEPSYRSQ